jgi:hypothetical protein
MKRLSSFLAVSFLVLPGTLHAQQNLLTEAQWMNGWASWMSSYANNVGKANVQAQAVEAQAKLISAQASYITAQAGANKTNAEAIQALEQAKGLALDNSLKRAKTFYDKKALHQNYKALVQGSRTRSPEDYLRISRASVPQRLNEEQFDSLRGMIAWPSLLRSKEFELERNQLNELFEKRLDYPQDVSQEVKLAVDRMEGRLLLMVKESDQTEYAKAKKFLRGLSYESRFQTGVGRVASN